MKFVIALVFLTLVISVTAGPQCGSNVCNDDQCCSGGFYHRYCRSFADEGTPCEVPNRLNEYKVSCPCKRRVVLQYYSILPEEVNTNFGEDNS